jgi:lipoyl(octanoyl) transferase
VETVRLLPLEDADGPHNMAADEVMLQSALAGQASLRFYTWTQPTLSLGYFQPAAARLADPLLASLPFVRRPTGGHDLVHHYEVTYALALPPGAGWQAGEPWLMRMHRILADAFCTLGVELTLVQSVTRDPATVLCFRQRTPGDLVCRGAKVVGSAQRRHRQCLLQHGGILLGRSPHTPSLPGIREQTGRDLQAAQVCGKAAAAFMRATGWSLMAAGWTAEERATIATLARQKYSAPEWNEKR